MKGSKNGNLAKVVAFFVIVILAVCSLSFMTSGWQFNFINDNSGDVAKDDSNQADNDKNDKNNGSQNDNSEGDTDNSDKDEVISTVKPLPEFIHKITGEEVSAERANASPLCFVMNSAYPAYGLSASYLTIEIPTEHGKTRFLAFVDSTTELGKIGSIADSRLYMSDVAATFGGTVISIGNDDMYSYPSGIKDQPTHYNISASTKYHYTEYSEYVYTNSTLLSSLFAKSNKSSQSELHDACYLPYCFQDFYTDRVSYNSSAMLISVTFGDGNVTRLCYDEQTVKYTLSKNSSTVKDMLSDAVCTYDNAFILFADSTTVETESVTQTVFNTTGGGKGYYATGGTYTEITWGQDDNGMLTFYNTLGEQLTVNRGTSYIAYAKSNKTSAVEIK